MPTNIQLSAVSSADPDTLIPVSVSSFSFSAGETQVRVSGLENLGMDSVSSLNIKAQVYSAQDLIELALVLDALSDIRGKLGFSINLELPYFPYSRQDRSCAPGEAFSLYVVTQLLISSLTSGDTVTTWDVHSNVTGDLVEGEYATFINVPASHFCKRLLQFPTGRYNPDNSNVIVVAPDKGAVNRAKEVQEELGFSDTVFATKVRDPNTGHILETQVPEVDYKGKRLLIVDDICDGGRTFIELAKVLRKYEPESIDLYVTHGIFSKGFEPFGNLIDQFYVANLLPNRNFYDTLPTNITLLAQ